jgi:hypothetical protein
MRKLEFEMKLHIQSFVKSIGNRKKKPIFWKNYCEVMSKIDKNVSIKTRVNLSNYCNQGEAMRKLECD